MFGYSVRIMLGIFGYYPLNAHNTTVKNAKLFAYFSRN